MLFHSTVTVFKFMSRRNHKENKGERQLHLTRFHPKFEDLSKGPHLSEPTHKATMVKPSGQVTHLPEKCV